jgi:hypothetical protein
MVMLNGLNVAIEGDKAGIVFTPTSGGASGACGHVPAGKFSPNTPSRVRFPARR